MRKTAVLFGLIGAMACTAPAAKAQTLKDIFNNAVNGGNSNNSGTNTGKSRGGTNTGNNNSGGNGLNISGLSNSDVVGGLRQALQVGVQNASGRLSTVNGFFGNSLIKVLMPPEAKKVENTLRQVGMGEVVDKAILSMNRAAEDASGKAVPIFVNAITSMSIQDGVSILKGGNGAATNFLRAKTTVALTAAFRPVIENSLKKVGATAYWRDVFNVYNQLPTTFNKINPDLTAYVTERALNGLFVNIADEENKIRTNPAARVTDLLQKVFGAH
ncbi:DUF4197 domain-containing protein [Chitinophagaceae bacterium MMS25-I14]